MPLRPVSELGLADVTDLPSQEHHETASPHPPRTEAQSPRPDSGREARADRTLGRPERARRATSGGGRTGRSKSKRIGASTSNGSGRARSGAERMPERFGTSPSRLARTPKRSGSLHSPTSSDGAVKSKSSGAPKASVGSTGHKRSSRPSASSEVGTPRSLRSVSASAGKGVRSGNGRSSSVSANRRKSRPRSQRERNSDSRELPCASPGKKSQDKKKGSLGVKIGIPVLSGAIGVAGGVLLSGIGLQR